MTRLQAIEIRLFLIIMLFRILILHANRQTKKFRQLDGLAFIHSSYEWQYLRTKLETAKNNSTLTKALNISAAH